MEKIPYRIPDYHKMVWRAAHNEAWGFVTSDKRVVAGNILLAVASGYATARLVDSWSNAVMISPFLQWLAIVIGTIIGLFVLYGFRFITNGFWIFPAKYYRERETDAWLNTWNDVEIKEYKFPAAFGNFVGLELTSYKNTITGSFHEISILVNEVKLWELSSGATMNEPKIDLQLYTTDEIRFHPGTSIQNKRELDNSENWATHIVLPIVEWDNNSAWISGKNGDKELVLIENKPYRAVITFGDCVIQMGDPIKSVCGVWCDVIYKRGANEQPDVELLISKRNPPYAYEKKQKRDSK